MNKRKCQVHAVFPITCFTVPIIGHTELNLTTDEIYKCLCAKAEISEILPSGKVVRLDFSNYNKSPLINKEEDTKEESKKEIESSVLTTDTKLENKKEIETPLLNTDTSLENNEKENSEHSPVKTHEVSSRNNNYKQNNYYKNKKNNYKQNKR